MSCAARKALSIDTDAPRAFSPTSAMWPDTICVPEAATVVWLAISLIAPCCWPMVAAIEDAITIMIAKAEEPPA